MTINPTNRSKVSLFELNARNIVYAASVRR